MIREQKIKRLLGICFCLVLMAGFLNLTALATETVPEQTTQSEIVWSQERSDGTVMEEMDEDGNYYFHVPEGSTARDIIQYFRDAYDLDRSNFSISYACPDSGETYAYNDTNFMHAASTYKLPLNMYYYDQERIGEFDEDTYIDGYDLEEAHYQSIVWSDNDISEAMIYYLGSYEEYKTLMNDEYGHMDESELDESYWWGNYFCTKFMMNTLQELYARQDEFEELIDYMLEAAPEEKLTLYSGDVPVAHKVGDYESNVNDVGITFTEHPFLIAVYTEDLDMPDEVIGRINAALIAYQNELAEQEHAAQAEAEAAEAAEAAAAEAAEAEAEAAEAAEAAAAEAEEAQVEESAEEAEEVQSETAQTAPETESTARQQTTGSTSNSDATWNALIMLSLSVVGVALLILIITLIYIIRKNREEKQ